MALRIEDVSSLPGSKVFDQMAEELGEIKEIYGLGEDAEPMWVAIETTGDESKLVVIPLARLRQEGDEFSVPYSAEHVKEGPDVEADDEISEQDDEKLRLYYSIGLADEEFRTESNSYAGQVPEGEAPAKKITDDMDDKETPGGETEDRSLEQRHAEAKSEVEEQS